MQQKRNTVWLAPAIGSLDVNCLTFMQKSKCFFSHERICFNLRTWFASALFCMFQVNVIFSLIPFVRIDRTFFRVVCSWCVVNDSNVYVCSQFIQSIIDLSPPPFYPLPPSLWGPHINRQSLCRHSCCKHQSSCTEQISVISLHFFLSESTKTHKKVHSIGVKVSIKAKYGTAIINTMRCGQHFNQVAKHFGTGRLARGTTTKMTTNKFAATQSLEALLMREIDVEIGFKTVFAINSVIYCVM